MTKVKFKLRQKPSKPKIKMLKKYLSIYDGSNLLNLADALREEGVPLAEAVFNCCTDYHGGEYYEVSFEHPEPFERFQIRLDTYKKKKSEWDKWYEENREQVEEILAQKKEKSRKQKSAGIRKNCEDLRKQLLKLEKEENSLL